MSSTSGRFIGEWFDLVDIHCTGQICMADFQRALQSVQLNADQRALREIFDLADFNRDGHISRQEFFHLFSCEIAAGRDPLSADYVLPSGRPLALGLMVAKLRRRRMMAQVIEGSGRAQWVQKAEEVETYIARKRSLIRQEFGHPSDGSDADGAESQQQLLPRWARQQRSNARPGARGAGAGGLFSLSLEYDASDPISPSVPRWRRQLEFSDGADWPSAQPSPPCPSPGPPQPPPAQSPQMPRHLVTEMDPPPAQHRPALTSAAGCEAGGTGSSGAVVSAARESMAASRGAAAAAAAAAPQTGAASDGSAAAAPPPSLSPAPIMLPDPRCMLEARPASTLTPDGHDDALGGTGAAGGTCKLGCEAGGRSTGEGRGPSCCSGVKIDNGHVCGTGGTSGGGTHAPSGADPFHRSAEATARSSSGSPSQGGTPPVGEPPPGGTPPPPAAGRMSPLGQLTLPVVVAAGPAGRLSHPPPLVVPPTPSPPTPTWHTPKPSDQPHLSGHTWSALGASAGTPASAPQELTVQPVVVEYTPRSPSRSQIWRGPRSISGPSSTARTPIAPSDGSSSIAAGVAGHTVRRTLSRPMSRQVSYSYDLSCSLSSPQDWGASVPPPAQVIAAASAAIMTSSSAPPGFLRASHQRANGDVGNEPSPVSNTSAAHADGDSGGGSGLVSATAPSLANRGTGMLCSDEDCPVGQASQPTRSSAQDLKKFQAALISTARQRDPQHGPLIPSPKALSAKAAALLVARQAASRPQLPPPVRLFPSPVWCDNDSVDQAGWMCGRDGAGTAAAVSPGSERDRPAVSPSRERTSRCEARASPLLLPNLACPTSSSRQDKAVLQSCVALGTHVGPASPVSPGGTGSTQQGPRQQATRQQARKTAQGLDVDSNLPLLPLSLEGVSPWQTRPLT